MSQAVQAASGTTFAKLLHRRALDHQRHRRLGLAYRRQRSACHQWWVNAPDGVDIIVFHLADKIWRCKTKETAVVTVADNKHRNTS